MAYRPGVLVAGFAASRVPEDARTISSPLNCTFIGDLSGDLSGSTIRRSMVPYDVVVDQYHRGAGLFEILRDRG